MRVLFLLDSVILEMEQVRGCLPTESLRLLVSMIGEGEMYSVFLASEYTVDAFELSSVSSGGRCTSTGTVKFVDFGG